MFFLRYLTSGGGLHLSSNKGITQKIGKAQLHIQEDGFSSCKFKQNEKKKIYVPSSSEVQTCNTALPHLHEQVHKNQQH